MKEGELKSFVSSIVVMVLVFVAYAAFNSTPSEAASQNAANVFGGMNIQIPH